MSSPAIAATSSKKYDIILFGVTGFTGRLCAEYLWKKQQNGGLSWAVSARNADKAERIFQDLLQANDNNNNNNSNPSLPDVLVADLVCQTDEDKKKLTAIVEQTKVVLTCSGPFEKYGPDLVQACAAKGVYYADITGETDYVRQTIQKHDATAQSSGAALVSHCGHDCIPCDLMVFEMNQFASNQGCELQQVMTYQQFAEEAAFSGGTAATAAFQLGKDRSKNTTTLFDPLVTDRNGEKSEFRTINTCPKTSVDVPALPGRKAGPWIMAPVMVNCVRRSNALLGYAKELQYGDCSVQVESWTAWAKNMAAASVIAAATYQPLLFGRFLPQPGEGPSREDMEKGFLKLYATATMVDKNDPSKTRQLKGLFEFRKDTAYLYTAALLCETGLLMVEKYGSLSGGCWTPAAALGGDLTERILKELDASLEIKELVIEE